MIPDEKSYQVDLHPFASLTTVSIHKWTKLGEGDNLWEALTYAIDETDWIPDGPHDNFRLMGQGDLTDLRIE